MLLIRASCDVGLVGNQLSGVIEVVTINTCFSVGTEVFIKP